MNIKLIEDIEQIIVDQISKESFTFNEILANFEEYCSKFDHSSNVKGDLFEHFCYMYLKRIKKYEKVWLYKNIPLEIKNKLDLTTMDYGIDLVCKDKHNNYYAIQSKYRKRQNYKTNLSWRNLSTFYAMVQKTGPFVKYIVMTTTDGITNIGRKLDKEEFIGFHEFNKIDINGWKEISNYKIKNTKNDLQELREKRIKYFENINE